MIDTPTTPHRFATAALSALLLAGFISHSQAQTLPDAAQVAAYAEKLLDEQKLGRDGPGVAVLVARGDQVLYRGARGMASVELGVPLSPDQVFRIGSVTKQFAAATLLKLIDDGRAKLDDPLSKYLPDYPNGQAITLQQLLNHTSGVKSYTGISGYMNNPVRRELSTQELVAEFKNLPVDFAPGASWNYNNSGYVLVGAVIEAISGKAWHEQLQESLLTPQKLSKTAYPGETRLIKGMVNGYGFDPKEGADHRRHDQHDPAARRRCTGVQRGRPVALESGAAQRQTAVCAKLYQDDHARRPCGGKRLWLRHHRRPLCGANRCCSTAAASMASRLHWPMCPRARSVSLCYATPPARASASTWCRASWARLRWDCPTRTSNRWT